MYHKKASSHTLFKFHRMPTPALDSRTELAKRGVKQGEEGLIQRPWRGLELEYRHVVAGGALLPHHSTSTRTCSLPPCVVIGTSLTHLLHNIPTCTPILRTSIRQDHYTTRKCTIAISDILETATEGTNGRSDGFEVADAASRQQRVGHALLVSLAGSLTSLAQLLALALILPIEVYRHVGKRITCSTVCMLTAAYTDVPQQNSRPRAFAPGLTLTCDVVSTCSRLRHC